MATPASLSKPFAVFDIEALSWDRYRVAQFITSEGDEVRCNTPAQLNAEVKRFQGRVFAHYGGRYDFFFLEEPTTAALSGSGILRAQLGKASLYDSWFLFQMSLKKVGEAVGHAKWEGKSDNIEALTDDETAAHCLNDCHVLRIGLERHREWCATRGHEKPRWPATAGGTAMYCFEAYEADGVEHLRRESMPVETWFAHYAAVTGGRVEMWALGEVRGPVYTYDINSSYPRSWCDAPLPLGPWRHVTAEAAPGFKAVYRATVRQGREALPVVAPGHVWRYDGEAWLTDEELATVRMYGGAVEIHEGWVSQTHERWFGRDFATQLYEAKQKGDPWAKVSVNSGHGKYGQSIIQASHVKRGRAWEVDYELNMPAWYQRPLVSAFVLSRARLRLHDTLMQLVRAGWEVYYVDTDCVHTNCPPDQFPGAQSAALGDWKLEVIAERAVYVAPKVYGLLLHPTSPDVLKGKAKAGDLKLAAKGLPKAKVTWQHLVKARREPQHFVDASGLVSFKGQKGVWGARAASRTRTLRAQTGGKSIVEISQKKSRLTYPETRLYADTD